MPIYDHSLIAALLGVEAPWAVTGVLVSSSSHIVTVGIEQPSSRAKLFARRTTTPARRQLRWEHIGFGGWRCKVMLSVRDGDPLPVATWAGDSAAQPYTRGLQSTILDLLIAGATVEQLAVLLRLPFADLWRYKFRLDQGRGAVVGPSEALAAAPTHVNPAKVAAGATSVVPDENHSVWLALLLGRISLDVRMLGLRLLLAKLQRDAGLHSETDLHRQAAGEIHRYFVRSRTSLQHELEQMCAHAARVAAARPHPASMEPPLPTANPVDTGSAFELPEASDPLWLALIEGQCAIDVRQLGLRLLLVKLRTQLRRASDDDLRMVKLVELHRYFARHQITLAHEIEQIRCWSGH